MELVSESLTIHQVVICILYAFVLTMSMTLFF